MRFLMAEAEAEAETMLSSVCEEEPRFPATNSVHSHRHAFMEGGSLSKTINLTI